MHSSNFNLRGIPVEMMALLRQEAKDHHVSMNSLILTFIEQGIGFSHKVKRTSYHDLDSLSGTWAREDSNEFLENTKALEKIDSELWS